MAATYSIDCGIICHSLPKYGRDPAAELAPEKHTVFPCSSQLSIGARQRRKPHHDFPDACLPICVCNLLGYPANAARRAMAEAELLPNYCYYISFGVCSLEAMTQVIQG